MNSEDQEVIRLGMEAEKFLSSALGRYLVSRADELIEAETLRLIQADPTDVKMNTECRNGIQIGALFKQWLEDAIIDGQNTASDYDEIDPLS